MFICIDCISTNRFPASIKLMQQNLNLMDPLEGLSIKSKFISLTSVCINYTIMQLTLMAPFAINPLFNGQVFDLMTIHP